MKNIKPILAALTLTVVMTFGTTFTYGGIVVQGLDTENVEVCTEATDTNVDFGIVVQGLTGIVVQGFTGIVVQGATAETQINCGIVVQG